MFDYMPFPNHNKAISLYILINKSFERCVAYLIALYNTHYDSKEETDTKGNGMGVIQGYCDSKQQTDTKGKGMGVIQGYCDSKEETNTKGKGRGHNSLV
jgi:hypothetical protein